MELEEAHGHERDLIASALWHLRGDLSEEAREQGYLSCLQEYRRGGYPEATARLSEALKNPTFRQTLSDEYAAFWTAYSQDRSLMRFHFHKTEEIWNSLKDLSLPRREFSTAMAELPEAKQFITEDEINAALSGGSSFSGGKGRIYDFFREPHTPKEQTDFLKKEYGIGGHSHALSHATGSHEDHDGKGLRYADGRHELKITDTGGGITMIVFNTRYGFMRWSTYFALCFWRLRLKISRSGA